MRTPFKTLTNFKEESLGALNSILINIWGAINQGIEFGNVDNGAENIRCSIKTFTTPSTANIEFDVTHTLGKEPTGYLIVNKNLAGDVYDGSTVNTDTKLYLKCDTASVSGTIVVI